MPRPTTAADAQAISARLHTTHTVASAPKFSENRRGVVATLPCMLPENAFADSVSSLPGEPPARLQSCGSGRLRARDFHSTNVLACLRGGDVPEVLARRAEAAVAAVAESGYGATDCVSLGASGASLGPAVVRAASATRAGSGVAHCGRSNIHSKNIIFPTEAPPEVESRGLWCRKALPNGSHVMLQKRHLSDVVGRSSSAARADSPSRGSGKRILDVPGHIVGSSLTVTEAPRLRVAHRIEAYHQQTAVGTFLAGGGKNPDADDSGNAGAIGYNPQHVGLLGYGATGRRRIENVGAGFNLLEHRDDGWGEAAQNQKPSGLAVVPGQSHTSKVVWELGRYTPQELNERTFRPHQVRLEGPPPFVPEQMPRRALSPARGVRHVARDESRIFPVGETPSAPNPHVPYIPIRQGGLGVGRFSPLRQQPLSQRAGSPLS